MQAWSCCTLLPLIGRRPYSIEAQLSSRTIVQAATPCCFLLLVGAPTAAKQTRIKANFKAAALNGLGSLPKQAHVVLLAIHWAASWHVAHTLPAFCSSRFHAVHDTKGSRPANIDTTYLAAEHGHMPAKADYHHPMC